MCSTNTNYVCKNARTVVSLALFSGRYRLQDCALTSSERA